MNHNIIKHLFFLFFLFGFSFNVYSETLPAIDFRSNEDKNSAPSLVFNKTTISYPAKEGIPVKSRIVLIVLDGVRTEEVFIGSYPYAKKRNYRHSRRFLMPFLWTVLAKNKNTITIGNIYSRKNYSYCKIDNPSGRSLPAYANLFSGKIQTNVITNNFKETIRFPGIFDDLVEKQNFNKNHFAVFTSWGPIQNILSQTRLQSDFIDTGYKNKSPRPPWKHARYDYYTYKSVLQFLNSNKDFRFLFIGFNDSDEWAHYGKYSRYLRSIRRQDYYIKNIFEHLQKHSSQTYKTTFIITTDHGRGRGRYWRGHSARLKGPANIWTFIHSYNHLLYTRKPVRTQTGLLKRKCQHTAIANYIRNILKH